MRAEHRGMDDVMSIFQFYSTRFDVVLLNFFEILTDRIQMNLLLGFLRTGLSICLFPYDHY